MSKLSDKLNETLGNGVNYDDIIGAFDAIQPEATANDVGKSMIVQKRYTKDATIVPEQGIVFESHEPVAITNANTDLFVNGQTVVATINGVDYNGTVTIDEDEQAAGVMFEEAGFYINDNVLYYFSDSPSMPFTDQIALYAATEKYEYGLGSNTLTVRLAQGSGVVEASATFADVKNVISRGGIVRVAVLGEGTRAFYDLTSADVDDTGEYNRFIFKNIICTSKGWVMPVG